MTAAVMCLGQSEDDACFPWATSYLWEAKVRKIISGAEFQKRFLVLFGRHALKKQDLHSVLAIMTKLEAAQTRVPAIKS